MYRTLVYIIITDKYGITCNQGSSELILKFFFHRRDMVLKTLYAIYTFGTIE